MKQFFQLLALTVIVTSCSVTNKISKETINADERFAAEQYKILAKNTPDSVMPRYFDPKSGKYETAKNTWWTSGFYPGSLWLIYKATNDPAIKKEAEKRLALQENIKNFTGNHDIGFMIFCSFGTAYDITKNPEYKKVILTAAESATKRYNDKMQSIQSWNKSSRYEAPVIIDNMMNLELLEWATQNGGSRKYADIAKAHANTTMKNHFRPDNSSYHVVDYDPKTGQVLKKVTHQGFNDESAWSRGQAWGLYGYTMMYRFTKDQKYLDLAHKIAAYMLNHPNMPKDKIPYWDYNSPDIPNTSRDVSAGAITASALLELAQYSSGAQKKKYIADATTMIKAMSTTYRSAPGANGGFILTQSVGHYLGKFEIDVSLTYADYYYLEALDRYKKWVL